MKVAGRILKIIFFLGILGSGIFYISKALLPRIPDFYEEEHWDVVFFGTSQSYCTFDPEIFDDYNLKTYNRGRQQQTMNYTYYYVKDALDNSDIDVVVLEIFGMFYDEDDTGQEVSTTYTTDGKVTYDREFNWRWTDDSKETLLSSVHRLLGELICLFVALYS